MPFMRSPSPASSPTCPTHGRVLICPACVGTKGGKASGGEKAKASRQNAEKARQARAERRKEEN